MITANLPNKPVVQLAILLLGTALQCGPKATHVPCPRVPVVEEMCSIADPAMSPDSLSQVNCLADFNALASTPLDAQIPGARSVKVVYDTATGSLYFQHSTRFSIHYQFVSTHLSGHGMPLVQSLGTFNQSEYFRPDRRFYLGAVTHYEQPDIWALEVAPYDSMSATMMSTLFAAVKAHGYFGPTLTMHPTSDATSTETAQLGGGICVSQTEDIYNGTDYQPLTLGTTIGRLRFLTAAQLEGTHVSYDEIVVLDEAPNDISVVRALITQTFQTPLSHINVLAQNRHSPNMGLRGAMSNARLRALDGRIVELAVQPLQWTVREATAAEADAWWAANRPTPVTLPPLDLSTRGLVDVEAATPEPAAGQSLRDALRTAIRTFGGKCAHYSVMSRTPEIPMRKAFCIPMFYYDQFMRSNGVYDRIAMLQMDDAFRTDPAVRDARLQEVQNMILTGQVDQELQTLLRTKIAAEYGSTDVRFRSSTNSEDLDGFPCAGCYNSHSGSPTDWNNLLQGIRKTWASAWSFRTFEERSFYGVDHRSVGMALLVHHDFPNEEANGVAATSNIFDPSGMDPAFYVNVQQGGAFEVVAPPPGITSDQFLYYFSQPGQPVTYLARSSIVEPGQTVLNAAQIRELGVALQAIHQRFSPAYGPASGNMGWYAMDVEFKFDDDGRGGVPRLFVKQARPYPGRGVR